VFFILSKTLNWLLQPLVIITLVGITGMLMRNQARRKNFLIVAVTLFFLFTNEFLSNEFMRWYETPLEPMNTVTGKKYAWGIVLTGVTDPAMPLRDRVYINSSPDRVNHTVMLYKQGIIRRILVSGGNGQLLADDYREANELRKVFELAGVKSADIITESESRNTHENAVETVRLLRGVHPDSCLLITSASHMPRASRCFIKAGLPCDTFPTDSRTRKRSWSPDVLFIPSSRGLGLWETLFKEITGRIAYAVAGYT